MGGTDNFWRNPIQTNLCLTTKLLFHSRFPSSTYPVYAFKGAPGNFPSLPEHHFIQKYLHFSRMLESIADDYIRDEMGGQPYLAIHLRNGLDMVCGDFFSIPMFCKKQFTRKMQFSAFKRMVKKWFFWF